MKNFIELIKESLQIKLGIKDTDSLEYKELPYGDDR
jgi:hypothetical protein